MNILIAPNSFKGTLNASAAAKAIGRGIGKTRERANLKFSPMSDGGDGLIDIASNILGGHIKTADVSGPLNKPVKARYIFCENKTAIIEMAEASGIKYLKPRELDCMNATTFGVGQLINRAVKEGAKKIIIGLGGSASNDGGAGCAQGFGFKLLDEKGRDIPRGAAGLLKLAKIENSIRAKLKDCQIIALSDVSNPLCGKTGSARVFGPQKGASSSDVKVMEKALIHYSKIIGFELKKNVKRVKGGGAAGGLASGLYAFFDAELIDGAEYIFNITGLEDDIKNADLIITGEGKFDGQSLAGKGFHKLSKLSLKHKKPIIVICGRSEVRSERLLRSNSIKHIVELEQLFEGENLFLKPEKWIEKASRFEIGRIIKTIEKEAKG